MYMLAGHRKGNAIRLAIPAPAARCIKTNILVFSPFWLAEISGKKDMYVQNRDKFLPALRKLTAPKRSEPLSKVLHDYGRRYFSRTRRLRRRYDNESRDDKLLADVRNQRGPCARSHGETSAELNLHLATTWTSESPRSLLPTIAAQSGKEQNSLQVYPGR